MEGGRTGEREEYRERERERDIFQELSEGVT